MKHEDYKKAMDGIKCSDGFRREMEQKLTEEAPAEQFADTVSELEHVPGIAMKRIAATAAAFIIIGTAGGALYHAAKQLPTDNPTQDVTGASAAEVPESPTHSITAAEGMVPFLDIIQDKFEIIVSENDSVQFYTAEGKEQKMILSRLMELPWENTVDYVSTMSRNRSVDIRIDEKHLMTIYFDGLGQYSYMDSNGNLINKYYSFSAEDYGKLRLLIDEFYGGDKTATEMAHNMIDDYLSDSCKSGRWEESGSQIAHGVEFDIDSLAPLREVMKSYQWDNADPSEFNWSEPFCTIGGLMIDSNGIIMDNELTYAAVTPPEQNATAGSVIQTAIRNMIDEDEIANAQFVLINMTEAFNTLTMPVSYSFSYDPETGMLGNTGRYSVMRSGKGTLFIDNQSGREYMTVTDTDHCYSTRPEGNTIEMVSDGELYAFIDHYTGDMPPMTGYQDTNGDPAIYFHGSRFYNTPQMFYSQLKEQVLAKLEQLHEFPDKVEQITTVTPDCIGVNLGHITIDWRGDTGTQLSMTIGFDKYGIMTNCTYTAKEPDSEPEVIYDLQLLNDSGLPVISEYDGQYKGMDSPDFTMPDFTEEQQRCMKYPMESRLER